MDLKFSEMAQSIQEVEDLPMRKERKRLERVRRLTMSEEWVLFPCWNRRVYQQIVHKHNADWYIIKNTLYFNGMAIHTYEGLDDVTELTIYKKRYLMFFHGSFIEVVDTMSRWYGRTQFPEKIDAMCISGSVIMVGYVSRCFNYVTFTDERKFEQITVYYSDRGPARQRVMCDGQFHYPSQPTLQHGDPLPPNTFVLAEEKECGQITTNDSRCTIHDWHHHTGHYFRETELFDINERHERYRANVARRIMHRNAGPANACMNDKPHTQPPGPPAPQA
jgi:hypothetical protein